MLRFVFLIFLLIFTIVSLADDFPFRRRYPELSYISLYDFHRIKNKVIIVDVRTRSAYDYLHIENALHIHYIHNKPVPNLEFLESIKTLDETTNKEFVFYCFGYDCNASYEAARKAERFLMLRNKVWVFDGGMLDWARVYPTEVAPIANIDQYLQFHAEVEDKSVPLEEFLQQLETDKYILLNLSKGNIFNPFPLTSIRLSMVTQQERMDKFIEKSRRENIPLYIFDKSTRAYITPLRYFKEKNFDNYIFMGGGIFEYNQMLLRQYYN